VRRPLSRDHRERADAGNVVTIAIAGSAHDPDTNRLIQLGQSQRSPAQRSRNRPAYTALIHLTVPARSADGRVRDGGAVLFGGHCGFASSRHAVAGQGL
jgi:hypothetical protein